MSKSLTRWHPPPLQQSFHSLPRGGKGRVRAPPAREAQLTAMMAGRVHSSPMTADKGSGVAWTRTPSRWGLLDLDGMASLRPRPRAPNSELSAPAAHVCAPREKERVAG